MIKRLVLLFLFCPLLSSSCSSQSDALVGFCWVSPPLSDMTLFEDGFLMAHHLGCEIEHRQYNWNEIEREKNVYSWNALDQWYNTCLKHDIIPSLAVCPVNSNSTRRNLPKDLEGRPFDDPDVILRLKTFTEELFRRYPRIAYVSFGNEINYYLRGRPEDYDPYRTMCLSLYTYTRENYPHVKCLVIFGFTGMERKEEEMIREFLPACDLVGISTYHAAVNVESNTPPHLSEEEMRRTLEYCITLCHGKRAAIVETCAFSYPDPGYQAEYVHVFFETVREFGNEIEFACWFSLYDWYPGTLGMLDPFLEQFSTAGLLTPDGLAKPSYYAWVEEMNQYRGGVPSRISSVLPVVTILCILFILVTARE